MKEVLTLEEHLKEQAAHCKCQAPAQTAGNITSCDFIDPDIILMRIALNDDAIQIFILVRLRSSILYLSHYTTERHTGGTAKIDQVQYDANKVLLAANEVYTLVKQCCSCAQNRSQATHKQEIQLLPAVGPVQFMAIDILDR